MSEQGAALLPNPILGSEENNHWDFSKKLLFAILLLFLAGSLTTLFFLFYNPALLTSFTSLTLEVLTTVTLVTTCIFIMLLAQMASNKNRTAIVGWVFTIASFIGFALGFIDPDLFSVFAKYAQIACYVFFTATVFFQRKEWAALFALIISIAAIAILSLTLLNPSLLSFLDVPPETMVVKSLVVAIVSCAITVGIFAIELCNNKMREWKKFYREHRLAANLIRGATWVLIFLLICLPAALWFNDWHLTHWTSLDVDLDSSSILSKFTLSMQFIMIGGFLTFWWVKNTLNEAIVEQPSHSSAPNQASDTALLLAVSNAVISNSAAQTLGNDNQDDDEEEYTEAKDEKDEGSNASASGSGSEKEEDDDEEKKSDEEDRATEENGNDRPPVALSAEDKASQFPSPPGTVTPSSSVAIITASSS